MKHEISEDDIPKYNSLNDYYRKRAEEKMIKNHRKKRKHFLKEYGIDIGPLRY